MKILVLAPQWPDPPRQGAAIRNIHILLHLTNYHDVTLFTFSPPGGAAARDRLHGLARAEILDLSSRSRRQRLAMLLTSSEPDMAWRLRSEQMSRLVVEAAQGHFFDAVHVEGIEMAPYGLLAAEVGGAALTYDAHNAEYLLQRRAFTTDLRAWRRWPRAFYSLIQWWRLRRFERSLCERAAHVIAVSDADAEMLKRLAGSARGRVTVLPNGVDVDYWSQGADYSALDLPPKSIVFDGTMDFRPNVDAVGWFVREVWPAIRASSPDAEFFIVGRDPSREVRALSSAPSVTVTGAVADTRPWVSAATVYVVPMRMGGGVRLKVLQAMAMEKAIVSTTMGVEGVAVENGRQVLIAGSASGFARSVLALLADTARRADLGLAARRLAVERYAWPVLLPVLDTIYPADAPHTRTPA